MRAPGHEPGSVGLALRRVEPRVRGSTLLPRRDHTTWMVPCIHGWMMQM